jgi:hypothetical protein
MSQVQKHARVEVLVAATVPQVWDVVTDVTRVGEWSHECLGADWLGDAHGPSVGARFRGRNRAGRFGWARWSRTCEIVVLNPPSEIVWRTVPTRLFPDSTEWRIRLDIADGATRITQSFTVLRAPWLLDRLYAVLIPSHQDRDARLADDLRRMGEVAGAGARA